MISCTEFIPAYSELFKFIDRKSGREAVYKYWNDLFQPEKSPLNHLIPQYGPLMGCWKNWYVVHTEEACDNTMLCSLEEGWFISCMHHCPSKGRFEKLGYLEPFDEYCRHCDGYDTILKKFGLLQRMDYRGEEKAMCRSIMYDPKVLKEDPLAILDKMYACELEGCKFPEHPEECPFYKTADTLTLHTTSEAYKYLHRDFHTTMARGMQYTLEHYGEEGLREYLTQFTLAFHKPLLSQAKDRGLDAIAEYLTWLYTEEECPDALEMEATDTEVNVTIRYCPGVAHMKAHGYIPQASYERGTSVVYRVIAEESGLGFEMLAYDHDTGAAKFRFFKK